MSCSKNACLDCKNVRFSLKDNACAVIETEVVTDAINIVGNKMLFIHVCLYIDVVRWFIYGYGLYIIITVLYYIIYMEVSVNSMQYSVTSCAHVWETTT